MLIESCVHCALFSEPERIPKFWFLIDVTLAFFSLSLLLWLIAKVPSQTPLMNEVYVTYNILSCLVWCTELTLPVIAHGLIKLSGWWSKLEIVIAIYCIYDAFRALTRFRQDDDLSSDIILTAVINFVIYSYITIAIKMRYMTIKNAMACMYSSGIDSADGAVQDGAELLHKGGNKCLTESNISIL